MRNNAKNVAKALVSIFAIQAFATGAIAQNGEEKQFSEDINFTPADSMQIAAVATPHSTNITNSLLKRQPHNLSLLAGHFSALVNEAHNAAKPESLSSASRIAYFLDNSPALTGAGAIDGAKAMAVIAALNNQEFVDGVQNIASFMGKEELATKLSNNPSSVQSIKGYQAAKNNAASTLSFAFTRMNDASATIKQASYDLQKEKWSKIASDKQPHLEATAAAWKREANFAPISQDALNINHRAEAQVNDKLIATAALVALGDNDKAMQMLNLGSGKSCAIDAYLSLRMCISASKYPFEHSFCLSRHAYADLQDCAQAATK